MRNLATSLLFAALTYTALAFPGLFGVNTSTIGSAGKGSPASEPSGTNYYVRSGAGGAGNGTNWTDAYTAFGTSAGQVNPAALTRGATYYVADGTYGGMTVSTAASGTTGITIRKATVGAHGTSSGWSDTYGDGQAVFSSQVSFFTPYINFLGVSRNEADWFDDTAYGFKVATPSDNVAVYAITSNSLIEYVAVIAKVLPGSSALQIDCFNFNGADPAQPVTNTRVSRCLTRNGCQGFFMRNTTYCTIEYCASEDAKSTDASHGEVVNWYGGPFGTVENNIYRWSIARDNFDPYTTDTGGYKAGTAVVAIVGAAGCQVYGNLFMRNHTSDAAVGWAGTFSGYEVTNLKVYQNTILGGNFQNGVQVETNSTGCEAKNNIWFYNSPAFTSVTHDYNAASADISGESNDQIITLAIFVDPPSDDWRLATNTTAGTNLGAPWNVDMLGNTRTTWSRGAYEYQP